MGKLLKRVPLDFDWPNDKTWKGYVNPHRGPRQCQECGGTGLNSETRQIENDFYDHDGFGERWTYDYGYAPDGSVATRPPWRILGESSQWSDNITQDEVEALVARDRLIDFTHTFTQDEGWKQKFWDTKGFWCPLCHESVPQLSHDHHTGLCSCTGEENEMELLKGDDIRLHTPMADEVNALNRGATMFGHDAINRCILIETRAKRLGVWGRCSKCRGKGVTKLPRKMKKRHKKWAEHDPPTGEGFQLWQDTSEGSPISQVFSTVEELADWCEEGASIFGSERTSRDQWLMMFRNDSVAAGSLLIVSEEGVSSGANHTSVDV